MNSKNFCFPTLDSSDGIGRLCVLSFAWSGHGCSVKVNKEMEQQPTASIPDTAGGSSTVSQSWLPAPAAARPSDGSGTNVWHAACCMYVPTCIWTTDRCTSFKLTQMLAVRTLVSSHLVTSVELLQISLIENYLVWSCGTHVCVCTLNDIRMYMYRLKCEQMMWRSGTCTSRKWLDWLCLHSVAVSQPWTELQRRFFDSCGRFPEADITFRNTWNLPLTGTPRRKHRTDSIDSCSLAAWLCLIYSSHTYIRIQVYGLCTRVRSCTCSHRHQTLCMDCTGLSLSFLK